MRIVTPALLLIALLFFPAPPVLAQGPLSRVQSSHPLPLVIEGVRQTGFPRDVPMGTEVCAPGEAVYTGEGERHRFLGWQVHGTLLTSLCIRAVDPGPYTALFRREVLLRAVAPVAGIAWARWVGEGALVPLTAPEVVPIGPDRRWRFLGWTGGISPFTPENTLVADRPQTVEARYALEYLVRVAAPEGVAASGEGWYGEGQTAVVRAPATVADGPGLRRRLVGWEGEGVPPDLLAQPRPTVTFRVTGPALLQPQYVEEVLVEGVGFQGAPLARVWARKGEVATLSAPETVEEREGVRWRFAGWSGGQDPLATTTRVAADRPITLHARYIPEYLVRAVVPGGAEVPGSGWYPPGAVATLQFPEVLQAGDRRWRWTGWEEEPPGAVQGRVVTLSVEGPVTLRPRYVPEVEEAPRPAGTVTLDADAPTPLLVDGEPVKGLPATLPAGSKVCVPSPYVYVGEGERYRFLGWSAGGPDPCVTAPRGRLTARFQREVLLTIASPLTGLQQSRWVPLLQPVPLEAPAEVVVEGVRWVFEGWSGGETPFSPSNTVVPTRPLTVEVHYTPEYWVAVSAPEGVEVKGQGWYRAGARAVVRAPAVVAQGEGRRLRFVGWEDAEGLLENPTRPDLVIAVQGALTLRPVYVQEYLVEAFTPQGLLTRTWVEAGKTVEVDAPSLIPIIEEEERLRFTHWQEKVPGGKPLARVAKLVMTVERPLTLEAVYRREFKVTLQAPFGGSGGGWYPENATAILSVPPQPQAVLFLRKTFQGFAGYPQTGPVLQVVVQGPTTVAALYRNEVDLRTLGFLLGGLLAAFLIWRATEARGTRPQPAPEQREEVIVEEVVEEEEPRPPLVATRSERPPGPGRVS
jgi:hypothetical protein